MTDEEAIAELMSGKPIVIRGGLNIFRRAKILALEDGRSWEDLPAETMDRYIALARAQRDADSGGTDK